MITIRHIKLHDIIPNPEVNKIINYFNREFSELIEHDTGKAIYYYNTNDGTIYFELSYDELILSKGKLTSACDTLKIDTRKIADIMHYFISKRFNIKCLKIDIYPDRFISLDVNGCIIAIEC